MSAPALSPAPADGFDTEVLGKHWIPLPICDSETAAELRARLGIDFTAATLRDGEVDGIVYLPVALYRRHGDRLHRDSLIFALTTDFVVTLQPAEPFAPFDAAIVELGRTPLLTASAHGVMCALLWAMNRESHQVLDAETRTLAAIREDLDGGACERRPAAEIREVLVRLDDVEQTLTRIRETQRELRRAVRYLESAAQVRAPELGSRVAGLRADVDGVAELAELTRDGLRHAGDSLRIRLAVERNRVLRVLTGVTLSGLGAVLVISAYGLNADLVPPWEYGAVAVTLLVAAVVAGVVSMARRGGPH